MSNLNWSAVIVNIIISAITAQIIININIKLLVRQLLEFKRSIIEDCTDEVANFVKKNLRH